MKPLFLFIVFTFCSISLESAPIKKLSNQSNQIEKEITILDKDLFEMGGASITLRALLKFFSILILTYLAALFVRRLIQRVNHLHTHVSDASLYTLSRLTFYFLIMIGITFASASIGVNFTTIAVIAGALSVGIGFGLQSIVNNFVSGIILLLEKNIRPKDIIQIDTLLGQVIEINIRTTLIKTLDNLEVLVPNSHLVEKNCINWTLSDKTRKLKIPFKVERSSDHDEVKKLCIEIAQSIPLTLSSAIPELWLKEFNEKCLSYELIVTINTYIEGLPTGETLSKYLIALDTAFKEKGIAVL
ncbi:MAG: mechanosensitive ion channel domain-containing protein [Simkaniaceae bacterium]